jgi:hypothetical protein
MTRQLKAVAPLSAASDLELVATGQRFFNIELERVLSSVRTSATPVGLPSSAFQELLASFANCCCACASHSSDSGLNCGALGSAKNAFH